MAVEKFFDWLSSLFGVRRSVRLGIYGSVNVGKCLAEGQKILLSDGTYENIESIFNRISNESSQKLNGKEDIINCSNFNIGVPSLNKENLKIEHQKITHVFRQKYKGKMYKIKTRLGREAIVSPEHPFITINQNGIHSIRAKELVENSFVSIISNFKPILSEQNFDVPSRFEKTPLGITLKMKHHYPKHILPRGRVTRDSARFFAYAISESQHTKNFISFFNEQPDILIDFENIVTSFGLQTSHYDYVRKTPERKVNSIVLNEYLSEVFDLQPSGSFGKKVPSTILKGKDYVVRQFLRTMFDCEGSVRTGENSAKMIEMTSASKDLIAGVQILLLRFGILGKMREKTIDGNKYHVLEIGRSQNHRMFRNKIGFSIESKKDSLDYISKFGSKANIHSIPIVDFLEKIRKEIGLSKKDFYGPKYDDSLFQKKMITIDRIKHMSMRLKNEGTDFISLLSESDVFWDKVVKIEPIEYDGFIYDLTINKNHTFSTWDGLIVHNTTLANKIAKDWTGEEVGKASEIPHETRFVQRKEKVEIKHKNKKLMINLLDMPGLATKIDFKDFIKYGMSKKAAKKRAREATDGVIEAIKWLNNVDTVLAVMDSTQDPLTQVNITLLGNLEARRIPVIIVANKIDKKKAKPDLIRDAFPQYPVIELSALKGHNMDNLYDAIAKHSRRG